MVEQQIEGIAFSDEVDAWNGKRNDMIREKRNRLAEIQAKYNRPFVTHTLAFAIAVPDSSGNEMVQVRSMQVLHDKPDDDGYYLMVDINGRVTNYKPFRRIGIGNRTERWPMDGVYAPRYFVEAGGTAVWFSPELDPDGVAAEVDTWCSEHLSAVPASPDPLDFPLEPVL